MLIWSLSSSCTILYNFIHLNINLFEITSLQVSKKIKTVRNIQNFFVPYSFIEHTLFIPILPLLLSISALKCPFHLMQLTAQGPFICFFSVFHVFQPLSLYLPQSQCSLKNSMHVNTQTHKNAKCWGNPMPFSIKSFCHVFLKGKTIFASIANP